MAGLAPAIQVLLRGHKNVDARDPSPPGPRTHLARRSFSEGGKPGHDEFRVTVRRAYLASSVFPIRKISIERAQSLPSRMAQTTSDWPRRMSPAENTFGSEV
jgi:hypothetical protein